ncbi:MAG: hypothetical protein ACE5EE_03685 [Fidelibacterota bacterium]
MTLGSTILIIGGILSLALSLLHVGMVFKGAPAYRYFNAGERMVNLAERGSPLPALITLFIATLFAAFGFYALSGSGLIPPLPLQHQALIIISSIYCLRGLAVIFELGNYFKTPTNSSIRMIIFSLVSLSIGIIYLMGTLAS